MRYFIDPRQRQLFDYTESQLSDVALKRLKSSYHAVYRYVILELMPVTEIGTMFHLVKAAYEGALLDGWFDPS